MRFSALRNICVALALVSTHFVTDCCRAEMFYLSLGDSVTFGIDPSTPAAQIPSFGDQGFVRPFADSLAAANGGVRPTVLNLAIAGELSTSFFTAASPPGWTSRVPQLNLNYPNGTTPQNSLMTSSINAIHAGGNSVGYASLMFGANDIFYLAGTPAFQAASPLDQQAMIGATIGTMQTNYVTALTTLTTLAPEANIILPFYYNPFPAFAPEHGFYNSILDGFRPLVQADAAAFGATFVDLGPLFAGRELELTNIATGDVHPNQAGYSVIAGALTQAVPEPSVVLIIGIGMLGLLGHGWQKRASKRRLSA